VGQGQQPDRDALLEQHPDLADELRSFFADHDGIQQAVDPMGDEAATMDNATDVLGATWVI
jgi:hypothetical protein